MRHKGVRQQREDDTLAHDQQNVSRGGEIITTELLEVEQKKNHQYGDVCHLSGQLQQFLFIAQ